MFSLISAAGSGALEAIGAHIRDGSEWSGSPSLGGKSHPHVRIQR